MSMYGTILDWLGVDSDHEHTRVQLSNSQPPAPKYPNTAYVQRRVKRDTQSFHERSSRHQRSQTTEHDKTNDHDVEEIELETDANCECATVHKSQPKPEPAPPPSSTHRQPHSMPSQAKELFRQLRPSHTLSGRDHDHEYNPFPDDPEWNAMVVDVEKAIALGIQPQLVATGSSGTYFVRNTQQQIVGVFKPKDEEPFAPLNPKWPKAMQRFFSPCCFGRKCLLSNHGYMCEVAASLVDDYLDLNVVPKTRLVWLASPALNYSKRHRGRPPDKLPVKVGSLQQFMAGYVTADEWFRRHSVEQLSVEQQQAYKLGMQKMVVIDYIIRNTDRKDDNWMIRVRDGGPSHTPPTGSPHTHSVTHSSQPSSNGEVHIAVIDNGLSFPLRHPIESSRLRAFPFYWAGLPLAREPFDEQLAVALLHKLDDPRFISLMCRALKDVFKHDEGYNPLQFRAQINVVRGQIANLRQALRQRESPAHLAGRHPLIAVKVIAKHEKRLKKSRRDDERQQQPDTRLVHTSQSPSQPSPSNQPDGANNEPKNRHVVITTSVHGAPTWQEHFDTITINKASCCTGCVIC